MRRLAVLTESARCTVGHRESLRENAIAGASIRAALKAADIDPLRVSCLRYIADAEPRLLGLGDTPELRQADAAFMAAERRPASQSLAALAAQKAPGFAGRPPPEGGASLVDWYAWSLARTRPAVEEPLPTLREREGPGAQRWEGEGL